MYRVANIWNRGSSNCTIFFRRITKLFETNFVNIFIELLSPNRDDKLTFGGSHTETLLHRFVPLEKTIYASWDVEAFSRTAPLSVGAKMPQTWFGFLTQWPFLRHRLQSRHAFSRNSSSGFWSRKLCCCQQGGWFCFFFFSSSFIVSFIT